MQGSLTDLPRGFREAGGSLWRIVRHWPSSANDGRSDSLETYGFALQSGVFPSRHGRVAAARVGG